MNDRTARHLAPSLGATRRRLGATLAMAVLAAATAGCGGSGGAAPTDACTVTGVTVSAGQASIATGATTTLTATVDASPACSTAVTWTLETAGGTLTPGGVTATFTSTTANAYTIRATSVADPTRSGSTTVTVTAPPVCTVTGVTVGATLATIPSGGTTTLTATLVATPACSTSLTWTVTPDGGALTPSGATATFTSTTATTTTYTITATSDADPTKSGTVDVTVEPPVVCTVAGVTVTASPATIPSGGTSTLTAVVDAGAGCSTAVTWSLETAGGTLTPGGATATFTSTTANTYTIRATSDADPTKSDTATVTVEPPPCVVAGVTVTATPGTIPNGGTSNLAAVVDASPTCSTAVTWTLETAGGTLTPGGATATFTSTTANTYTVRATSVADATKSGTATVTVEAPVCTVVAVTVTATPATIPNGGTSNLAATVDASPACSTAVTWTLETAGGTLTPGGATATFTSTTANAYTIRATSDADPTRSGTATVTVEPPVACTVAGVTVTATPTTISSGGTASLAATVDATATCSTAVTWSLETAGGTLTPGGATATFTSTTQTTFTVRATSVADPTKSGTATVTVGPPVACGLANGTVIEHRGVIAASETWAGDGVTHHIPASIDIRGDAVVTIEPCALVVLRANVNISTFDNARLVAAGTAGRRVTFTALDTLLRWGFLRAFSPTSLIDLSFTDLREGGEQGLLFGAMVAGLGGGYDAPPAPVLRLRSVSIEGSGGIGVYLDQNATFTADSTELTVTNCASYPVRANMMALGTLPPGSYTGNARKDGADEIVVTASGTVTADMTVKNLGVDYRVEVPAVEVGPAAPSAVPVTLTIEPGVVMRFPHLAFGAPGALVRFGNANGAGVLNAVAAPPLAPITFTSGELLPAPGDWAGLWLADAAGSRLDNVAIGFAGAPNGITSTNCKPDGLTDAAALVVGNSTSQYVPPADLITNSTITDSAGFGVNAIWQAATVDAPALVTPANNTTVTGFAGCRQSFNGLTAGSCPVGGGCTVP